MACAVVACRFHEHRHDTSFLKGEPTRLTCLHLALQSKKPAPSILRLLAEYPQAAGLKDACRYPPSFAAQPISPFATNTSQSQEPQTQTYTPLQMALKLKYDETVVKRLTELSREFLVADEYIVALTASEQSRMTSTVVRAKFATGEISSGTHVRRRARRAPNTSGAVLRTPHTTFADFCARRAACVRCARTTRPKSAGPRSSRTRRCSLTA